MKQLTYDQVAGRKEKAARFVRDVLEDDDRADEIEDESVEDYAERRKFAIVNPTIYKEKVMPTNKELQEQVRQLEQENEDLQDQLDKIADIAAPEDEDDDDAGDDDEYEVDDDDPGED